jgi:pyruvate/2-oxoglutarate dehydrogenase complex dihydrolipoamide acyltransferase (E2) component
VLNSQPVAGSLRPAEQPASGSLRPAEQPASGSLKTGDHPVRGSLKGATQPALMPKKGQKVSVTKVGVDGAQPDLSDPAVYQKLKASLIGKGASEEEAEAKLQSLMPKSPKSPKSPRKSPSRSPRGRSQSPGKSPRGEALAVERARRRAETAAQELGLDVLTDIRREEDELEAVRAEYERASGKQAPPGRWGNDIDWLWKKISECGGNPHVTAPSPGRSSQVKANCPFNDVLKESNK